MNSGFLRSMPNSCVSHTVRMQCLLNEGREGPAAQRLARAQFHFRGTAASLRRPRKVKRVSEAMHILIEQISFT
jgi:hypothetical protein